MRRLIFLLLFVGAGGAALLLSACGDDSGPPPLADGGRDGSSGCVTGRINCGGACIDPETDFQHCGMCGNRCRSTETCAAGRCQMMTDCPMGEIDCGGMCVNPEADDLHCGRCGNQCNASQDCMGGSCILAACPSGQDRCSTACVDRQTDEANCGSCGTRCADGQECRAGSCQNLCGSGEVLCEVDGMSRCANLMSDAEHCGSCGNVCTGGRACVGGACECESGNMLCGRNCVDLQTDSANCGSCARRCSSGISCVAGDCACSGGLELCGLFCRNLQVDDSNCGSCGNTCGSGLTCMTGSCVSSCGSGMVMCGASCVNLETDDGHCGACGNTCSAGEDCTAGVCRPENDERMMATDITLADAEVTIMGSTTDATRDGPTVPCICTSRGNVWYRFTLAAESIVYFDTAGSSFDTSLFITDDAGVAVPGQMAAGFPEDGLCNDDARCPSGAGGWTSTLQSRTAGRLSAGTYYLSVSGCGTGDFVIHAQRVVQDASWWYPLRLNGSGTTSTRLVGASMQNASCEIARGTTSGEDQRWFLSCGDEPQFFSLCPSDGGSWTYLDGGSTYDPVLFIHSAQSGDEEVCNDDGGTMGGSDCTATGTTFGWGSRINDHVVPRGLSSIYVDSATGGPGMDYTLRYITR